MILKIMYITSVSTYSKLLSYIFVKVKLSSTSIRDESEAESRSGETTGEFIKEGYNIELGISEQDRRFTLETFKDTLQYKTCMNVHE